MLYYTGKKFCYGKLRYLDVWPVQARGGSGDYVLSPAMGKGSEYSNWVCKLGEGRSENRFNELSGLFES